MAERSRAASDRSGGSKAGEPAARATITCLCLDPVAGKIVAAPASLLATLERTAA